LNSAEKRAPTALPPQPPRNVTINATTGRRQNLKSADDDVENMG